MTLIPWRDEFSIGIASVDHEHQMLIASINDLHAQMQKPMARDAVVAFLGEIHARISAHFALEEREMRERRYANLAEHKRDHERLLDEIRDIMDAYEDDAYFDKARLAQRLVDWFSTHFRTHDALWHKSIVAH
ncbi:MAG: bacteriohemerythrin [Gammaproteobacteria bacterium]|nr:bacteriohemerythrin [Gammaproteobacteria bacterium]